MGDLRMTYAAMESAPSAAARLGTRSRLILVEDDVSVRRGLQLLLHGYGFDVQSFGSAAPVLVAGDVLAATHIVVDFALPDYDGVALVHALRDRGWDGVAVLITAFPTAELTDAATAAGFAAVLSKPFDDQRLLAALRGTVRS